MIYEMTLSFEEQQQVEGLLGNFDPPRQKALSTLFKGLNREQVSALSHPISEGRPLLIVAGAGSGKTSVLTRRVALLLLAGVPPERLFVSTFTVKAAGEMKERIVKVLVDLADKVPELAPFLAELHRNLASAWIGTFHSLCLRMLKERRPDGFTPFEELGYPPTVQVLADKESREILRNIIDTMPVKLDLRDLSAAIDLGANELMTPDSLKGDEPYAGIQSDILSEAWAKYIEEKKTRGAVDFTDLLYLAATALAEKRVCAEGWKTRFTHVLIDEYQDTNIAQYAIATELAAAYKNLFVVGDDDQSIYGFRGADVRNIRAFTQDYPNARVVRLIRNYRSTPIILGAANAVLLDKTDGMDKTLLASADFGDKPPEKIVIYEAIDETDEMNFVVFQIQELVKEGFQYKDIVLFYRVHELSKFATDILREKGIPCVDAVGMTLTQKDVVKTLRAALTAVHILRLKREGRLDVVQHGFKLQDALKEIWTLGVLGPKNKEDADMLLALPAPERILLEDTAFVEAIQKCNSSLTQTHLETLWSALHGGAQSLDSLKPAELLRLVVQALGLEGLAAENSNVRYEITLLYRFLEARLPAPPAGIEGLEQLLASLQLSDRGEPVADLVQENVVRLLTIHASKGLEFPVVFVIGVEEDILPFVHMSEVSKETEDEKHAREDEELRLFYVAITRAKQQLILTCAAKRQWYGKELTHRPSRFLSRLPDDLVVRGSALSGMDKAAHRTKQFFKDLFSA